MLFQLHIPKTGGTSLFSALSAAVYPGRLHVALSRQEVEERRTGFALLSGHFDWDILDLFPEPPRVLTVLRDPVDLALSAYGYLQVRAREGVFNPTAQAAANEAVARSVDDLVLDPGSRLRANIGITTNFLAGNKQVIAGNGLEAASRHLEECAWVATTATLDRDMQLLSTMIGLPPIGKPARHLANPGRPQRTDIGKEALQVLESLTENDRKLYDRARAIADEQHRRYA